jgi:apolipoprotein N-acyltransferase
VLVNTAIAETVLHARNGLFQTAPASGSWRAPLASVTAAVLLIVAVLSYGFAVLTEKLPSPRMKVALVQANIPNSQSRVGALRQALLEKQAKLTRNVANGAPELIIWSETAVSGDVQHTPGLRKQISQLAVDVNSYLLVGSAENAKFTNRDLRGKFYNSMVLFTPEGSVAGEYRKIQLVPFGEYVPLRRYISWPSAIAPEMGDLLAGDQHTLFDVRGVKFATTICWELIFPELFREFVKKGAAFMTIATNEAWFGETGAPYELLAMSVLRAAENRVAIARAANTGISAFIDPFGRITQRLRGADLKDLFVEGVLVGDIAISRTQTFYTRYGDLFAYSQIGVCALTLVYTLLKALS